MDKVDVVGRFEHLILVALMILGFGAYGEAARLRGVFWFLTPPEAERPVEAWKEDLDAVQGLGMNVMVLAGGWFGQSAAAPDPMEAFFVEADRRGLELYVDTALVQNWWTLPEPGPEIARAKERIALLQRRFGGHPSFKGWYIPYELYVFWDEQASLIRKLYLEVAAACRAADPGKKVMISPFFILDSAQQLGDFRYATPDEYREFWTGLLKDTSIDIVALQDSGEHLSCYTVDDRRPFFAAMKAACAATGKTLWGNVETGELEVASIEEYVKRYGLKTHVNDPKTASAWRGVPADKLAAKLNMAGEFTDTVITWGYKEFVRPEKSRGAELYEAYRRSMNR